MLRYILLLASTATLGCAGGSLLGGSSDPPGGANSDDEVRAFIESGVAAFNGHEANRFMAQFGADIRIHTPAGRVNGYAAVRERVVAAFEQYPEVRMEIDSLRTRRIAEGTVAADFRWRVHPEPHGQAFHGAGSAVYVLRGGDWEGVLVYAGVGFADGPAAAPR